MQPAFWSVAGLRVLRDEARSRLRMQKPVYHYGLGYGAAVVAAHSAQMLPGLGKVVAVGRRMVVLVAVEVVRIPQVLY